MSFLVIQLRYTPCSTIFRFISNHALMMTQRHSAATYSVASTLGRIADGEWLRACENVKQVAPTIGTMGEWRAFCDGGWTGDLPQGLPADDSAGFDAGSGGISGSQPQEQQYSGSMTFNTPGEDTHLNIPGEPATVMRSVSPQDDTRRDQSLHSSQPSPNGSPQPSHQSFNKSPPSSFDPPPKLQPVDTGSVRTLSAFPSPPSHFPIPNMGARSPLSEGVVSASPFKESHGDRSDLGRSSVSFPSSQDAASSNGDGAMEKDTRRVTDSPEPVVQATAKPISPSREFEEKEFGVLGQKTPLRMGASDVSPARGTVERNDTGASNESFVAAMRNRYSVSQAVSYPLLRATLPLLTSVHSNRPRLALPLRRLIIALPTASQI